MCINNLIVICSSSVDKHRVTVPIWKRRSCRVPLCGLEVRTVKKKKNSNIKCLGLKFQNISKHLIPWAFHIIALWLRNIVQRICPHCWVGHERTKANRQSKGESQTEIINTPNMPLTYSFRCFKISEAGCKLLLLKNRKCLSLVINSNRSDRIFSLKILVIGWTCWI